MINPNPPASPSTQQQQQAQQLAQLQQMLGNQQGPGAQQPMTSPWAGAASLMSALMTPQQVGDNGQATPLQAIGYGSGDIINSILGGGGS